ncbi:MAG: PAS domain-containing protein [Planctomycetota bacterium]
MAKGAGILLFTVTLLLGSSLVYGDVNYTKDPIPRAPEAQDEGTADEQKDEDKVCLIQNFTDSSNALIYLKDDQGRFLMVNCAFVELFKSSKEQIIGKTGYDFCPKEDVDKWRANDRKVTEAGTPMNFKETNTLDDGQHTFISHKFPVSVEGSPNAVGGISIEITKCKCR